MSVQAQVSFSIESHFVKRVDLVSNAAKWDAYEITADTFAGDPDLTENEVIKIMTE